MDEKKTIIPDFGYVNLDTGRFEELPKPKVENVEQKTGTMLRLKLSAPYEQVYVYISLENPSTGQKRTIDAKVDTGAAVTVIPKSVVEGDEHSVYFEMELISEDAMLLV